MASLAQKIERLSHPEPNSGCWLWIGYARRTKSAQHELRPRLMIDGRPALAHRVSYEAFRGPIPSGARVCHSCDTTLCVNPDHLWVGTVADNNADCRRKGRHSCGDRVGEANPRSKLTAADVLAIRSAQASISDLARRYSVKQSTISHILAGRSWRHLLPRNAV